MIFCGHFSFGVLWFKFRLTLVFNCKKKFDEVFEDLCLILITKSLIYIVNIVNNLKKNLVSIYFRKMAVKTMKKRALFSIWCNNSSLITCRINDR